MRHAATEHTAQRRFSGSTGIDPALSEFGEWQANRLAARLATGPDIAAVLTSPAARTRRTAELIAAACGTSVEVEPALREVDFGGWEGRTGPEVERDWATELAAWRAGAPVRPPGGETVAEVAARVAAARDGVARRYAGGTVLLVSHLYPIRTSVADALGVPAATIHRMALGPASLSEIRGTGVLVRYNDESHLD